MNTIVAREVLANSCKPGWLVARPPRLTSSSSSATQPALADPERCPSQLGAQTFLSGVFKNQNLPNSSLTSELTPELTPELTQS